MANIWFTSDWHLGHKGILKYRTGFKTPEEHNQTFVDSFNKVVHKRDTVYFLGDIVFEPEYLQTIRELKACKKVLVLGNHDYLKAEEYLTVFDEVLGFKGYKNFWISHCPIHPQELRGRVGNIHGHLHGSILDDSRYFDVSPEKHNFELVNLEKIKLYFKKE